MKIRKVEQCRQPVAKRVAAYARVSTLSERQDESYETQVKYYTEYIGHVSGWTFVKVFSDHGKTGTGVKKRPGFMEMIAAAERHEFDILLVKSISRFARNAADAVKYVHRLTSCGIEVIFEKEGLSSFNPSTELVLNMMAVVAQEESRSLSKNIRWGFVKRMEAGKCVIGSNRVMGYDQIDGVFVPNQDAWIVRQIFDDYASGVPMMQIIDRLEASGARTMRTKGRFKVANIIQTVRNEIYRGDRFLQKNPPVNYLTKRPDPTVAYESRYIHFDHEPIIDEETWNRAQERLSREREEHSRGIRKSTRTHPLYGKIYCSRCGKVFARINTTPENGHHVKAWQCVGRRRGEKGTRCKNDIIREDDLLRLISESLGWAWNGVENFDVKAFDAVVDHVEVVSKKEVRVILMENVVSA